MYYPIMNRADLYSLSILLTGKKAEDLREDEVYYESCFQFPAMTSTLMTMKGYNGNSYSTPIKLLKGWQNYEYFDNAG